MCAVFQIASYPFEVSCYPHVFEFEQALDQALAAFRLPQRPSSAVWFHTPFQHQTRFGILRSKAAGSHFQVDIQLEPGAEQVDPIRLVDAFEPEIVNQAVRESPLHLWIHGACLVRGDELILLVAHTGTGKTTLSLGLLHTGYQLLTDDIILLNPATRQVIPVPRCPKYRPGALENLQSIGFDLEAEAQLMGHYVLLPPHRFQLQPVPGPIQRVYALRRESGVPSGIHPLTLSDGLLELMPHTNLLAIDPELALADRLFADTEFFSLNLNNFAEDIRRIAL